MITVMSLTLNACGFMAGSSSPEIHTFILNTGRPAETLPIVSGRMRTGTLLVNVPRAQSGFDTQRMAYVIHPPEVKYYARNQWADSPTQMLLPLLVQTLDGAKLWKTVVQMPSTVRGDYRLDTENLVLHQEFMSEPSRVHVNVRMLLIELKSHRPIATHEFSVQEDAPSDDAYGGAIAANRAISKLLSQISDWLSTCMIEPKLGNC